MALVCDLSIELYGPNRSGANALVTPIDDLQNKDVAITNYEFFEKFKL
jgi:hypothetical protein